ncbi:MAG TPA: hypothetical protein PLF71_00495 [bacterium]|nr:MAG: hypothetical protein BWY14_00419 [Parcubacteria group bacterium ADurb.Bin192]HPN14585.1 hypothetical protein [bacterium]
MSAYRDKDRGGFDEILHAFASIIKTLHFLGAFAVVYVMMNKIGEDIKQKLKRPAEEPAPPAVVEKRCPLSNVAKVKTPVRDTFGVCLTDEVRYICDDQVLTARADTIWRVETRSCYEHEKHPKPKSGSPSKKVALTTWIQLGIFLAPFATVFMIASIWLFNLESIIVWWEEVGSWMNAEENKNRVNFLFGISSLGGFVAWFIALSLLIQKADTPPSYAVKTPCSTLYFVDGTVMQHVTMITPAMEFTTITGVQKLDLKRSDSQTACGLTADEMRALADRLKEVISDHRYEIARALGVERYNRTVRLLPDLKVFDTET